MAAGRIDLIHELVSAAAADAPDRTAIITPDGAGVTFAEFDRQINAVSAWVSRRTQRGDRVAVIADNGLPYAQLYYAVPRSGRILTLINQRLSPGEQISQLTSAAPTLLLGDARYLSAVGRSVPSAAEVVTFDDANWHRAVDHPTPHRESVRPDDPAWLLFTSGSTGIPKGVLHTHRSITTAVRGTVAGRSVRTGGVYLLRSRCATSRATTCWFTTVRARRCSQLSRFGPTSSPPWSTLIGGRRARWHRRCCTPCSHISSRPTPSFRRCATCPTDRPPSLPTSCGGPSPGSTSAFTRATE